MAKAKRERRTSIRTMQSDDALSALDALEAAERRAAPEGEEPPAAAAADRDDEEPEAR
ncbi:MAG: hypothetical protein MUE51_06455 [Thermoleophilia bacterium]|jgi:hypothetical protein|nr:hypothetical protein [Thermoleophilia bacterium]